MSYLGQSLFDVDYRADEMHRDAVVSAGMNDVVPKLLAFFFSPRIGALVDRNDEQDVHAAELREVLFSE